MTNSMKKIKQEEIKEAKGDRCYFLQSSRGKPLCKMSLYKRLGLSGI